LVFFGYALCPDVCPTTLSAIADTMAKLGPSPDQVQPLVKLDENRLAGWGRAQAGRVFEPCIGLHFVNQSHPSGTSETKGPPLGGVEAKGRARNILFEYPKA
jgi:SCO1/SenC